MNIEARTQSKPTKSVQSHKRHCTYRFNDAWEKKMIRKAVKRIFPDFVLPFEHAVPEKKELIQSLGLSSFNAYKLIRDASYLRDYKAVWIQFENIKTSSDVELVCLRPQGLTLQNKDVDSTELVELQEILKDFMLTIQRFNMDIISEALVAKKETILLGANKIPFFESFDETQPYLVFSILANYIWPESLRMDGFIFSERLLQELDFTDHNFIATTLESGLPPILTSRSLSEIVKAFLKNKFHTKHESEVISLSARFVTRTGELKEGTIVFRRLFHYYMGKMYLSFFGLVYGLMGTAESLPAILSNHVQGMPTVLMKRKAVEIRDTQLIQNFYRRVPLNQLAGNTKKICGIKEREGDENNLLKPLQSLDIPSREISLGNSFIEQTCQMELLDDIHRKHISPEDQGRKQI